jgi:hypothetical protein
MGDYDIVAIFEALDDAVAARFSLQLGMLGNVRTRTLKAFPEAAYREIINSLGWSANGVLRKSHGLFRSGFTRISYRAIESLRSRLAKWSLRFARVCSLSAAETVGCAVSFSCSEPESPQ